MKYGGTITILDDHGEVRFERELDADEMIGELLNELAREKLEVGGPQLIVTSENIGKVVADVKDALGVAYNTREPAAPELLVATQGWSKGTPKPCCGSKGSRHMKTCGKEEELAGDEIPPEAPSRLTEREFKSIKEMRQESAQASSLGIARALDLPLQQVNYALLQRTYDDYVRHFNYQNKD